MRAANYSGIVDSKEGSLKDGHVSKIEDSPGGKSTNNRKLGFYIDQIEAERSRSAIFLALDCARELTVCNQTAFFMFFVVLACLILS